MVNSVPRTLHIALKVESARQAERFYCRLFGLMAAKHDGEAGRALSRGGFKLVLLEQAEEPAANGRLDHICLVVLEEDRRRLRAAAAALGCQILEECASLLVLSDPYGLVWKVLTEPAEG